MKSAYNVYIRDQNFNILMELTDFEKLEMIKRFNEVSQFSLTMNSSSPQAKYIFSLLRQGGGRAGIVVKRNDQVLFSGPFLPRNLKGEFTEKKTTTLTLGGADDLYYLKTRLAVPKNASGQYAPPFDGEPYSIFKGVAETVMHQYVAVNAGHLATDPRKIPRLRMAVDGKKGKTITGRARFDNLLELLKALALKGGGLGFRVVQISFNQETSDHSEPKLEFQVYRPEDKTDWVIFSPSRGNLAEFDYTQEPPEANFVIAGGGGEGKSRYFAWAGDEPSRAFYGTIEGFLDKRNTGSAEPTEEEKKEIIDSIYEELENKTERTGLSIKPIDTAAIKFGRDYKEGDKVSVVIEDSEGKPEVIQDIAREVSITLDQNGEQIEPVIGTTGVGTTLRLLDRIRNLEARLSQLEKR
jgi:hypothetical protein